MFYFTIILVLSPIFFLVSNGQNEDASDDFYITDEDITSIGLIWSYKRPDNGPEGNSTSWKLRWSPDGTMIAVVYFDDVAIIFDSKTGDVIKILGSGTKKILDIINKDDNSTTRRVSEFDLTTRCWGYTTDPLAPLLRACAWSPDNKYLAVAGDHRLIQIYNTSTWKKEMELDGHKGSILSLDWSPNGKYLASGEGTDQVLPHNQADCEYAINIWDIFEKKVIFTLKGHEDSIVSLSWSKNGTRLVSASDDRNLKMWDTNNGSLLFTMGEGIGHSAGVLDVSWSPNQTLLVSGSRDFKVRRWYADTGLPLGKPLKDFNCVRSTQWHPSGRYILTSGVDQYIRILNGTTGSLIIEFDDATNTNSEVMSARWSPDGTKFASCSTVDATVRLYGIGYEENKDSDEDTGWVLGIPIFFIIAGIGIFIIYFTLSKELRQHRK
jgi:WD40 repeat protein